MFIDEHFLLENEFAEELFQKHATALPIIDYHNHLNPQYIAEDRQFSSITELWLGSDHYKWRLMRANGIEEEYVTGKGEDLAKFMKWAETLPYAMRNPLYHWSQLELKRYFGIEELLTKENGEAIYRRCNALLKEKEFSVRHLLQRMNVVIVCTTDDPADNLEFHRQIATTPFGVKV